MSSQPPEPKVRFPVRDFKPIQPPAAAMSVLCLLNDHGGMLPVAVIGQNFDFQTWTEQRYDAFKSLNVRARVIKVPIWRE